MLTPVLLLLSVWWSVAQATSLHLCGWSCVGIPFWALIKSRWLMKDPKCQTALSSYVQQSDCPFWKPFALACREHDIFHTESMHSGPKLSDIGHSADKVPAALRCFPRQVSGFYGFSTILSTTFSTGHLYQTGKDLSSHPNRRWYRPFSVFIPFVSF